MKAFYTAACALILTLAAPAIAHETMPKPAVPVLKPTVIPHHSGGTDAKGCHTNHTTGEYHCHKPK